METSRLKSQQGVALIVVLMMVAIIASLSVQIASSTSFAITRSINEQERSQAYWYGIGMESLATNLMKDYLGQVERVHLGQPWALTMLTPYTRELEDGAVGTVQVVDLSSRFNLNALRRAPVRANSGQDNTSQSSGQKKAEKIYQQLLEALNLDSSQVSELRDTLVDYMDADNTRGNNGAEDPVYLSKPVPYRTPGNFIQGVSELRAVEGYTQQIVQSLRPLLVALPASSYKINVNTITKDGWPVLSAILKNRLNMQEVLELIETRPTQGWKDFDQFKTMIKEIKSGATIDSEIKDGVIFTSHYFLLHLEITFPDERRKFIMESVLHKSEQKIKVVNRYVGRGV